MRSQTGGSDSSGWPTRGELVTEEVEAAVGVADEGLFGRILEAELGERLVHDPHRAAQLPACGREHDDVVHMPDTEEPAGLEALVQLSEEGGAGGTAR